MKVAVKLRSVDNIWDKYIEKLKNEADTILIYDEHLEEIYNDVQVMITTHIDLATLSKFPDLKKIILFKTGMDGLPVEQLEQKGISLECSHANSSLIAEHAVALAFSLLHRIPEFHNDLCNGIWYSDGKNYYWKSISDLTVGILGFGEIGKQIFKNIEGFTRDIIVLNKSGRYSENVVAANDFIDFIKRSDLIFICIPKTAETTDLFDRNIINLMLGKYIVNVARAEIINEEALYDALSKNILAGYAGDVWYNAPNKKNKTERVKPSNFSFEKLNNVIMSPHCSTHEKSAHERYIQDAVNKCIAYIKYR